VRKPGRRSAAELALVIDAGRRTPPPPPPDLSPSQARVWTDTVSSLPSNWIERASFPVLAALCRHIDRSRVLEETIASFDPAWLVDEDGLARYNKLAAMAEREAKQIVACSRALRLTPASRTHPVTAHRRAENHSDMPKPWGANVKGLVP
jgi:hypothetical protein